MYLDVDRLPVSFAALGEPGGKRRGQALGINAEARLERPVAGGQRVVEFGRASEVAHAEAIQPVERARAALAPYYDLHLELSRVHAWEKYSTRCSPNPAARPVGAALTAQ